MPPAAQQCFKSLRTKHAVQDSTKVIIDTIRVRRDPGRHSRATPSWREMIPPAGSARQRLTGANGGGARSRNATISRTKSQINESGFASLPGRDSEWPAQSLRIVL